MTRLHVLSLAVPTTLVALMCCLDSTNAFAGLQHHIMTAAQHVHQHAHQHQHQNLNLHEIHDTAILLQHSSAAFVKNLAHTYTNALQEHPLVTKMLTGGTLATAGDAVAQSQQQQQQSRSEAKKYDTRRATSFMVFDMAYRALQHVSFPIIVQHCHGQYLNALLTSVMALLTATATTTTTTTTTAAAAAATGAAGHLHHHHHLHDMMMMIFHPTQLQQQLQLHHHHHVMLLSSDYLAAMEQTLVSQLFIVPFLYYPVFFALTGAVQKLTPQAALERAKDSFWPLMQRNLLFWIPVQFVQFGFIDEQLQIPFLSAAGLCWTFILSVYAGSTKQYSSEISSSTSAEQPKVPDMSSLSEDDLVVIGESTTTTSSSDGIPSTGAADNRATVTL